MKTPRLQSATLRSVREEVLSGASFRQQVGSQSAPFCRRYSNSQGSREAKLLFDHWSCFADIELAFRLAKLLCDYWTCEALHVLVLRLFNLLCDFRNPQP